MRFSTIFARTLWGVLFVLRATLGHAQLVISPSGTVTLGTQGTRLQASSGYTSYQWTYNNTTVLITNTASYTATRPGYYRVQGVQNGQTSISAPVRVILPAPTPGSADRNFAYEQNVLQNGVTSSLNLDDASGVKSEQTIQYTDGLGRPVQKVNLKGSPLGRDIVNVQEYDAAGRESRTYLPYTVSSDGQLRTNAVGEQQSFYAWTPKIATSAGGPAYAERVFEDSPLNRVLEVGGVGTAWQVQRNGNGTSTFQGHTSKTRSRTNTADVADKVALWSYTSSASGTIGTASYALAGIGTLRVQEEKDEDGRLNQTYSNALGQLVGKRALTQTSTNRNNPITGYAYDIVGRLVMVLTPEGMQRAVEDNETVNTAFLERWAYFFEYDAQGNQSARKVPGKDWMYMAYDPWDRLVATQSGNQRTGNSAQWTWNYIKYDELNRPAVTGTFYYSGSRNALATSLEQDAATGTIGRYENSGVNNPIGGVTIGYTLDKSFPKNPPLALVSTAQYYDSYTLVQNNYSSLGYVQENSATGIVLPAAASTRTLGLPTASQTRVLGSTQWLASALYYDDRGRRIQSNVENHRRGFDRLSTQYDDATSRALVTYLYHRVVDATPTTAGNDTHSVRYRYTYDNNGRPQGVYALLDGLNGNTDEKLLSVNEYNELGQLVDSKLGCFQQANAATGVSARYLQSVDYRYTLRGQLDKINNRNISGVSRTDSWQLQGQEEWLDSHTPNEDADAYADLFGLELQYDREHTSSAPATISYNGNISSVMWHSRSPNNNKLRGYRFEYNQLNQVTAARYSAYDYNSATGSYDWNAEKYDAQGKGRFTTDGLSFDLNGNITALNRVGHLYAAGPTAGQYGPIDQLGYTYDGNRLRTVSDGISASAAPNDFEDNVQQADEYDYDANGNATADRNKGITVTYNELDLPSRITFSRANNSTLDFVYSATGEKLAQILTTRTGTTSTQQVDYIAGFIYGQGSRLLLTTPTGRAIFEPARSQPDKWVQEYHLRDHQGSLRLAFRGGGTDLMAKATMEPSASVQEEEQFDHLAETRRHDPAHARTGEYSTLLNARQQSVGPTLSLPVKAGDSLRVEVFGRYDTKRAMAAAPAILPVLDLANSSIPPGQSLEQPVAAPRNGAGRGLTAGLTVVWTGFSHLFHRSVARPQAYVRYNLYNKDSVLVKSDVQLLDDSADNAWQQLLLNLTAKEDGYVTVALENNSAKDVWFDDMRVASTQDMVVQENHYDPFGQNLVDIETLGDPDAKTQYSGKERIGDLGLEWAYYGARMYDSQLGRWHSPDPAAQYSSPFVGMGNNPVCRIDADGKFAFIPVLIGAAIGAYSGYSYGKSTGASGWALAGYALGGAVIGGFSGGMSAGIMASGSIASGTLSMFAGSFINSVGMNILTQGNYSNKLFFGAASIDMSTGNIGFLGKRGNSLADNIGYGVGAFSNASDAYGAAMGAFGAKAEDYDLITNNDVIGHSALVKNGEKIISVGPSEQLSKNELLFGSTPGTNDWPTHADEVGFAGLTSKINITNVKSGVLEPFANTTLSNLNYGVIHSGAFSCVTATSTALLKAGVLNIPVLRQPVLLELQMLVRQNPYYSQYLVR